MKKLGIVLGLLLAAIIGLAQQQTQITIEELKAEKEEPRLRQMIEQLENGSAADLFILFQYYERDYERKNAVVERAMRKFPDHEMTRVLQPTLFLKTELGEEQETLLRRLIAQFPNSNFDMERLMVAYGYVETGDEKKAYELVDEVKHLTLHLLGVNEIINLVAAYDQKQALSYAKRDLHKFLVNKTQDTPVAFGELTPARVYHQFAALYSKLLFAAEEFESSYAYSKEAKNDRDVRDVELELQFACLSSYFDKVYSTALPILSKAVSEGNMNPFIIQELKKAYKAENPSRDEDQYVVDLQTQFKAKIRASLQDKLIAESAPNIELYDVDGKKVSLADYKGKILVLDFWATWCGPCVASFPAMQLAVNHFANDEKVHFLFIHCFDNVADPFSDAKNFLSKHDYSFALYMDYADKTTRISPAAAAMKVDGIPAKFVIDGEGVIRFKGSGFAGNKEEAAEELIQMVEIVKSI